MPRTVSQEMSPQERRTRLLNGLKATSSEKVVVNFSHLAHALSMDEAEKLVENMAEMVGAVQTAYSTRVRKTRDAYCEIDRLATIEALEKKTIDTNKAAIDAQVKKGKG
ncbi:MAG: hypothetical protein KatS3mg087_1368 [Patescibacteria group bacterium]|nr:MAG: hypothetical protein KatS3mg087_1368 [Patescibacteria group bacterium]